MRQGNIPESVEMTKACDMHVHLRRGHMLEHTVPHTARNGGVAVVMPNTGNKLTGEKHILTGEHADQYRDEILKIAKREGYPNFQPLMTIYVNNATTPEIIREAFRRGVMAGKIYPVGVTTGSEDGIGDFNTPQINEVFAAMEQYDMVLCLHGETPGVFVMDREAHFLATLISIAERFPKLRIVLEHITTADAVETVMKLGNNVAATITLHHLAITLDHIVGGKLKPHNFCMPIAKRPTDREQLWAAIGNPKFFLGSDSAPHVRENKECDSGCAGIYTAPFLWPLAVKLFSDREMLLRMEEFMSDYGAAFYKILPSEWCNQKLTLVKKPFVIPPMYHGVVPFMAGETLPYSIAE